MAINPVELRLRQEQSKTTGAKKGGGELGTMAGLLGGGALGASAAATPAVAATAASPAVPAATGAAIAMGAIGGAGGGSALGGLLGEKVKPSSEGTTAIDRRIQAQAAPQVSGSAKLRDSIMALHEAPPEIKQQYAQPLVSAYFASLAKERSGGQV